MMRVGVKGEEKWFIKANKRSPMKLSGGPGRIGRILPARPRRMRIAPIMIKIISNMAKGIVYKKKMILFYLIRIPQSNQRNSSQ
jgi:hypothetical protein